ncbi:hypothetical protein ACQKM9_03780 [Viridibacillus sp. NPDC093762]|uniref:hypothetical protein n=1 Tax=Viridibacillus sp. NPDC093762 TaxID=3390720 RepID=UPI003D05FF14
MADGKDKEIIGFLIITFRHPYIPKFIKAGILGNMSNQFVELVFPHVALDRI